MPFTIQYVKLLHALESNFENYQTYEIMSTKARGNVLKVNYCYKNLIKTSNGTNNRKM